MNRKEFRSRLFKKTIKADATDYWERLYAELLFRINQLEELNCKCSFCFRDRVHFKKILEEIINDEHMPENPRPKNFTGKGDCGRKLGPAA